jgi:ATP-dependent Zn protease
VHPTGSARSGPPPDRPAASAPPPPPRWRNWLLFIGLLLTAVLFLLPIPKSSNVEQLGYSQLKSDIAAGQVSSVALGPDGSVSGQLTNGTKFTSSYPVGLQDPQFAQLLDQHNVHVTTQSARTSTWSVLLNLLPLAVIVALFVWSGRATRRQLAGLGGIGRSRGKVYDTERPGTTFADVAGYEGVKREVNEEVDFLRHPDRYRRAGAVGPKGVLMVGPRDSLAIRMGGRAAEQIVFSQTSAGAANDLAGATDLATRMVREFGMSAALDPVGFASGSPLYLGSGEVRNHPYAKATQRVIDEEVATLLREAEQRATVMLTNHRHAVDRLTELLLEREIIDGTAAVDILGHIPINRAEPADATAST